jgi:hypothetical protein
LHVREIFKLFDRAKAHGVKNLIINHPMFGLDFTYDAIRDTAGYGALVEQSACHYVDNRFDVFEPHLLSEHICAAGVDNSSIGSDLVQADNPTPVEDMRQAIKLSLASGFRENDVLLFVRNNPSLFIGILIPDDVHALQPQITESS